MSLAKPLTPEQRELFGKIAAFLVPAYKSMPSATAVGVHQAMLDEVLRVRPDLAEAFERGLSKIDASDIDGSLNALFRDDTGAFGAVSLSVSGGYYMTPQVRAALGYPGQESVPYDPHEVPDFMMDGLLEKVVRPLKQGKSNVAGETCAAAEHPAHAPKIRLPAG
eukprot:gene47226-64002_t